MTAWILDLDFGYLDLDFAYWTLDLGLIMSRQLTLFELFAKPRRSGVAPPQPAAGGSEEEPQPSCSYSSNRPTADHPADSVRKSASVGPPRSTGRGHPPLRQPSPGGSGVLRRSERKLVGRSYQEEETSESPGFFVLFSP